MYLTSNSNCQLVTVKIDVSFTLRVNVSVDWLEATGDQQRKSGIDKE